MSLTTPLLTGLDADGPAGRQTDDEISSDEAEDDEDALRTGVAATTTQQEQSRPARLGFFRRRRRRTDHDGGTTQLVGRVSKRLVVRIVVHNSRALFTQGRCSRAVVLHVCCCLVPPSRLHHAVASKVAGKVARKLNEKGVACDVTITADATRCEAMLVLRHIPAIVQRLGRRKLRAEIAKNLAKKGVDADLTVKRLRTAVPLFKRAQTAVGVSPRRQDLRQITTRKVRAGTDVFLFRQQQQRSVSDDDNEGGVGRTGPSSRRGRLFGRLRGNKRRSLSADAVDRLKKQQQQQAVPVAQGQGQGSAAALLVRGVRKKAAKMTGVHDFFGKKKRRRRRTGRDGGTESIREVET